jgi:hypothetical protein
MPSNRLPFVALAVACIAAAGVGGYFASRQNTVPAPAAASAVASTTPAPADRPLQQAEAVNDDAGRTPVATPAATPAAAETTQPRRAEPVKRATQAAKAPVVAAPQAPPVANRNGSSPAATIPSAAPQAPAPVPVAPDASAEPKVDERATVQEAPRVSEPPQKIFEELVVSANSVIGLQTETRLSTETARVEDRVEAKVTRDVKVGTAIAIPAGSRAIGSVTQVEQGGKFKERARLAIRFNTLVLPDGTRLPMSTETIYRDGEAPGNSAAQKVGGGAAAGAILGAILGGAKGAAIGATVGAGGGAAVVERGDRSAATLPAGTPLTVRLLTPVTVTVEQQ